MVLRRGAARRAGGKWGRGLALVAIVLVASVVGCGREAPSPLDSGQPEGVPHGQELQWRPCVAPMLTTEAMCATLGVPEGEGLGTIPLFVMKIASDGDVQVADPVVLLAGGPGQGASLVFPPFAEQLRTALPSRDIIILDQRGTGRSSALNCDLGDGFDAQTRAEIDMDKLLACAERWPHDPKNFTTEAAARDLEQLRIALGAPQLNLIGGSYGTRLALVYARMF
ncbi:MAG: alpha/beta fold hydrolase, partial [Nannocystaceae bacterium]